MLQLKSGQKRTDLLASAKAAHLWGLCILTMLQDIHSIVTGLLSLGCRWISTQAISGQVQQLCQLLAPTQLKSTAHQIMGSGMPFEPDKHSTSAL